MCDESGTSARGNTPIVGNITIQAKYSRFSGSTSRVSETAREEHPDEPAASSKTSLSQAAVARTLGPLDGARIPGGCGECDAYHLWPSELEHGRNQLDAVIARLAGPPADHNAIAAHGNGMVRRYRGYARGETRTRAPREGKGILSPPCLPAPPPGPAALSALSAGRRPPARRRGGCRAPRRSSCRRPSSASPRRRSRIPPRSSAPARA